MNLVRSVCFAAWYPWVVVGGLLLAGCSGNSGSESAAAVPPPTGHYEGPISYQGTELRVALELREDKPGQLQAEISFPQLPGLEFEAARTTYQAPQLRLEQQPGRPGAVTVQAVREGDFLRGVLSWEAVQANFVWVRRGSATPRPYQTTTVQLPASQLALTLLVPDDTTTARHPAVALFADDTHQAAAHHRADQLTRQGFVTTVVAVAAGSPTDSVALQAAVAVLQALRRNSAVDTLRVGVWARCGGAAVAVPAATLLKPRAAFLVLENVALASVEDTRPLLTLSRRRVPVLGLYAAADTSLNAKESARRLRNAVGYQRANKVLVFPGANVRFLVPGRSSPDGKWTWPTPAPGYLTAIEDWLK